MDPGQLDPQAPRRLEEIIGYLNFSSGAEDPQFLANLDALFGLVHDHSTASLPTRKTHSAPPPTWIALGRMIRAELDRLRGASEAFRQLDQAEAVLPLVFDHLLPAYREHHRDLLFHQTDESLFQPFFIGRACEAVLTRGGPWHESDRLVPDVLRRLNDSLGHRPVATLETDQKIQPYDHEWVRPVPLFIAGAGVARGPYHDLIRQTLEILQSTDRALLDRAWFDPGLLAELALDPRAHDFDHPVNRRPNYHFGGWDPNHIDNRGQYRRFVLRQVTLDALVTRPDRHSDLPRDQLLYESAAVLAGTMLMGSGITGSGPDSHDSSTTLATLLPVIASYRDAFYKRLLPRLPATHAKRLRAEATALRQPFGGARQDLNHSLARFRAEQLQHVHLAQLFARMGYTEAAARQARIVSVPSARMRSEIDCRLAIAHLEIDSGRLDPAVALVPECEDLLHRAIECGAMVDPWNILGFAGQYPLFPAVENSVHDHRIDELIELMGELFALYARLQKETAATRPDLRQQLSDGLDALARWWDQFASTEVSGVEGTSGRQACQSAGQVADAIAARHEAGTAAGDIAFWRNHVQHFRSPEAFAVLAETLIDRHDLVASMALLMLWLSRAEQIPLAEADHSFHVLALRWMTELWRPTGPATPHDPTVSSPVDLAEDPWPLAGKFFDHLEANADEYWQVPQLELIGDQARQGPHDNEEEDLASGGLFGAAYENVTYRDTTDDGFDGEMLEGDTHATDFELSLEADRISKRLALLVSVAQLWELAAAASTAHPTAADDRDDALAAWLEQALANRRRLLALLSTVHRYRIPPPSSALDAMIEYDRRRGIKDALVERIIVTCVETADAGRLIQATLGRDEPTAESEEWEAPARRALRAIFRGDAPSVRAAWPELLDTLRRQPLLYVPASRGGNPTRIVASRSIQRVLARLLTDAPRLGLLTETYRLIQTVQEMEWDHPVGPGAVTEFDRLFLIGCRGIIECLVDSSEDWPGPPPEEQGSGGPADLELVDCLEQATARLRRCWLNHSRNVRISVLEGVTDGRHWRKLKDFIQTYGHDLFTQQFMNYGNLRAIMHQGVDAYLASLEEESDADEPLRLLGDLDGRFPREDAVRWLELTVEAVMENYGEYVDYNTTTTQSDSGELLYTLLDFLRLAASYDRVAWNLKPVMIAHEVLVRRGRGEAAEMWHEAVTRRTAETADDHLTRFRKLSKKYGMRLATVADRLGQRFVHLLAIDRLTALVAPAIEDCRTDQPGQSFQRLEQEVARFTEEPGGVGFELPSWLEALEDEAARLRFPTPDPPDPATHLPRVRLSREDAQRQLDAWEAEPS